MPTINKAFTLEVTPEQFVNACDSTELYELRLLVIKRLNHMEDVENSKQMISNQKPSNHEN